MSDQVNLGHRKASPVAKLDINLLDFQLQSLQWAIDQENMDGGMMTHFYAPILDKNGSDTGHKYSPFSGVITTSQLPDVRGGFICEQVTIILK